jgi:LysR family transcriptional regulator, glycine cleavage system transcriptional activator
MTALRCFDAAARTGSFTRAAAELNLTQSAVSRQVAKLERAMGVCLFRRAGPYLQLTDRGRSYAAAIRPALATIASASARFRSELDDGVIALATLPSFGMRWLAPRLSRLAAELPELVVNLFARSDEFDFASETHDAAIHFGRPEWPGAVCDRLFGERCVAVVARNLGDSRGGDLAAVLERVPLLTLVNRPEAWEHWASLHQVSLSRRRSASRYEHFAMLIQAAQAGAGAALIPDFLISEELADGSLVPLSPKPLISNGAYYLVYPDEKLATPAFRKFRAWLLRQAQAQQ